MGLIMHSEVQVARSDALANVVGLCHGVSLRHGGVSPEPFASLNASFSVGDAPEAIRENRRRFAAALGVDGQQVVCARLVHGNTVAVVTGADRGRGFDDLANLVPDSDGLVTAEPGVILWMTFADCVPVLLCDPVRRVAGLAHAGWRGSLLRTATATVATMHDAFGTDPVDVLALIGPSIGPCCYEVGPEVRDAFDREWDDAAGLFRPGRNERPHLDLWEASRQALMATGVRPEAIEIAGRCTACNVVDFFSHRAEHGKTGRFATAIGFVE